MAIEKPDKTTDWKWKGQTMSTLFLLELCGGMGYKINSDSGRFGLMMNEMMTATAGKINNQ